MAIYRLYTPDYEDEFEASSLEHARQEASWRIRGEYGPWATSPCWVPATLWEETGEAPVDAWYEAIDPDAPRY